MAKGAQRIAAARRAGQELAVEVLEKLMNIGAGVVSHLQSTYATPEALLASGDLEKFWRAAEYTKDVASTLASYQSPKLKATVAVTLPQQMAPEEPRGTATLIPPGERVGNVIDFEQVYRQTIRKVQG